MGSDAPFHLKPGARLNLDVVEGKIVLEPVTDPSALDALCGMFAGYDFLTELEREHREEIERDETLRS